MSRSSSLRRLAVTVSRHACLALAALMLMPALRADAKTPGKTYCFLGVCHRVQTLDETARQVGKTVVKHTSFYDDCSKDRFNPCGLTSSGEAFRPGRPDNAASPIYPNGTKLLVFNPQTRQSAVIRVNNAGPYWGNRTLDVSRGVAEKLGFAKRGVARLEVKVIRAPTRAEATYSRNRVYAPVPGPTGTFGSIDQAFAGVATAFRQLLASPVDAGRQPRTETAAHTVDARISPAARRAEAARIAAADAARAKAEAVRRARHAAALVWAPKPASPELPSIAASIVEDEQIAAATVMAMLLAPPGTTEAERTLTRLVYAEAIPDLLAPAEVASLEDAAPLATAPAEIVRALTRLVYAEHAPALPEPEHEVRLAALAVPLAYPQSAPEFMAAGVAGPALALSASAAAAARAASFAEDSIEIGMPQSPALVKAPATALARIVQLAPSVVRASVAHDAGGRYLKASLPAIE